MTEVDEYSFVFTTDNGVTYNAVFVCYPSLFSNYELVAHNIFNFNLDVLNSQNDFSSSDERIGITIVSIFKKFFEATENAVIYVCDSIDNRQIARKRKFDYWFWKYNNGSVLKEDGIAIVEGEEILNTIIIHKQNPFLKEILIAFSELNENIGDKE